MKWIESHLDLRDHPKLGRLARSLEVSSPTAIGHLHLLWWWAVRYAKDGNLTGLEPAELADAMRWEGDPDQLLEALTRAGFLDADIDGLRIHDWLDHAGRGVASREEAQEAGIRGNHIRWHLERGVKSPTCPLCIGTRSGPDIGPSPTGQDRTGQDRTAQPINNHPESGPDREADRDDEFLRLCREVALEQAEERSRSGYQIRSREAFVAKLTQTEEVRNEARKRLGPSPAITELLEPIGTLGEPQETTQ